MSTRTFSSLKDFRRSLAQEQNEMRDVIARALVYGADHAVRAYNAATAKERPAEVSPARVLQRGSYEVLLYQDAKTPRAARLFERKLYAFAHGDLTEKLANKAHERLRHFFKNWRR